MEGLFLALVSFFSLLYIVFCAVQFFSKVDWSIMNSCKEKEEPFCITLADLVFFPGLVLFLVLACSCYIISFLRRTVVKEYKF